MTKKLFIKISAIVLTVILAVVGIVVVFFSLNKDNFIIQGEKVNNDVQYTEESLPMFTMYNTKAMSMSARTLATASVPTNTVQLTATLLPSNINDKTVDWTVSFVNPSSSWASGKTASDYVSVTPTSDGALTATVTAKKGFSEQVKITVTSRINEKATAYCVADYGKRLGSSASISFESQAINTNMSITSGSVQLVEAIRVINWQAVAAMFTGSFTYTPAYNSDYTKDSSTETVTISVKPTEEFYTALKAQGLAKSTNTWATVSNGGTQATIYNSLCSTNVIPVNGLEGAYETINKFNAAVLAATGSYEFEIKIVVKTDFETKEYLIPCQFNRDGAAFAAETASLNTSSIVL